MKRTKIIILLIVTIIFGYFIWNFVAIKRLETVAKEISPIAKTTIESLYTGNSKFIDTVSATDKVKTMLYRKMENLQNTKHHTPQVIQTSIDGMNVYSVVVVTYSESSYPHDYILKFKKINNKWTVVDLKKPL